MLLSVNWLKLPRAVRHLQAAALQARRASELQDLCRQKGLPLSGNKQKLVGQLVERDTLLSAAKPKELSDETKSRALTSGMNVLSLFDGISCGRLALERAGIRVNKYFASEIDPHAIAVSKARWNDIDHLGDVKDVSFHDLPSIDLILAGSPCQGFSLLGKQMGLDDPRSRLFLEFIRLRQELAPPFWLLENVKMKPAFHARLNEKCGVLSMAINSSLVSAQNRPRLYWFPWDVELPDDKGLVLQDVLEPPATADQAMLTKDGKSCCILTYYRAIGTQKTLEHCIHKRKQTTQVLRGSSRSAKILLEEWRGMTPVEVERLQTLPDGYTDGAGLSDNQRYKALGNCWTVDVIVHILQAMPHMTCFLSDRPAGRGAV